MTLSSLLAQLMNGLAEASTLFLVAAGLSLIFGVTRIVNFAHGSFHMLGIYLAYTLVAHLGGGPWGFWGAIGLAALTVAVLGAVVEVLILRRLYGAPELLQLLATFALVLVIKDASLWLWGAEDLFGPRAPGLAGAVMIAGQRLGQYDLLLIVIGPLILALMSLLLNRTRWGTLIRAATQDREMLAALGVNQAWLFTSVFALGCLLAGLGGALQSPRVPATLSLDLDTIGNAFVVVVVGGMGSLNGAFLAALLIAGVKALCVALGTVTLGDTTIVFSKLTLVVEFLVMAIVLVWRPWGLCGKPQSTQRSRVDLDPPLHAASRWQCHGGVLLLLLLIAAPLLSPQFPYLTVLLVEILIAILFAVSLHFIMGPGGMHSFGHAAYFGAGAYAAALLLIRLHQPMLVALAMGPLFGALAALLFGWFCVRLSGVYLAMLTLAFAQITWAVVFQWDDVTGGSNGLIGIWPDDWAASPVVFYYLALGMSVAGVLLLRRVVFAPFGLALRATRDAAMRAETIGIDGRRTQWLAFILAGAVCGLAGALFAFSKGSISPDAVSIGRSVDGLVMVMLGGVQSLLGPVVGAALFTWLQDLIARETDYWRALLGLTILALVMLFPDGLAGGFTRLFQRAIRRETS
ncbi:branched-chain amino acid transport system permease protein [Herbaspirillum sp. Sphag1AN]|uniref:ABC transporter permease n=1 Tax=unclassified Herbaspirillum TaxID=2624150 RepID=UPI0016103C64|nr:MULTISPECIES: ABC transporter permease [unclassified Herbaspirillum]MBB3212709.1 branched-chain amino acid transport system permease protein [Herbaspirillum sp. Sphag1AN]MBB3245906.1 branched-chain amino acid transport system permease protein [Herbaspirillum sp. Sphag64]